MTGMEASFNEMHQSINKIYDHKNKIEDILSKLEEDESKKEVNKEGKALVKMMKEWDEGMVQRKSKAYDDVENYPNKFSAEYLYLINQTESAIPRVNKPSRDLRIELDKKWAMHKSVADDILLNKIPAFNSLLWEHGIGALWMK
jgi:hypothetical protein